MSVLKLNNKITWAWLKEKGFWRDGWGSPDYRKQHNTKMYEAVLENPLDEEFPYTWHIMYFPKTFEGIYINSGRPVNVMGRVVMTRTSPASDEYFISPMVKDTQDIEMFINNVFSKSWSKFSINEYFKSGYFGGPI